MNAKRNVLLLFLFAVILFPLACDKNDDNDDNVLVDDDDNNDATDDDATPGEPLEHGGALHDWLRSVVIIGAELIDYGDSWGKPKYKVVVHKWDRHVWREIAEFDKTYVEDGVWGVNENDFWVLAGEPRYYASFLHYVAGTWKVEKTTTEWVVFQAAGGSEADDVYFVTRYFDAYVPFSDRDVIYHYDGDRIRAVHVGRYGMQGSIKQELSDIWVSPSGYVFAVGDSWDYDRLKESFFLLTYDGRVWREFTWAGRLAHSSLNGVWGRSDSEVYISGATYNGSFENVAPVFFRYDGTLWHDIRPPSDDRLVGCGTITGDDAGTIFVECGDSEIEQDRIFAFDGETWRDLEIPLLEEYTFSTGVTGMWATPTGVLFVARYQLGIQVYDGQSWRLMSSPNFSEQFAGFYLDE